MQRALNIWQHIRATIELRVKIVRDEVTHKSFEVRIHTSNVKVALPVQRHSFHVQKRKHHLEHTLTVSHVQRITVELDHSLDVNMQLLVVSQLVRPCYVSID